MLGFQKVDYQEQDPANAKAAEKMGQLHDRLKAIGYEGHALEVYLVRLLFCLFAEDTSIFERQQFQHFIERRTAPDGSDLAAKLAELFQTLNTPPDKRFKNLDEDLAAFPYVNGRLFEEPLPMASFDTAMRLALLNGCYVDWSKISPAIFGAMFQSVMDPQARRNLGAHYTSEQNILKLIKPLFLDELRAEFDRINNQKTGQKAKLTQFHEKLSQLRFLDPACGCGNFLIMTYRELRLLELDVLKSLYKKGNSNLSLDISLELKIQVDQFYGIEYEEFPARIAEVAMWLIDHQMNMLISAEFGQYYVRLPLKKAANIVHGNALQHDWESIISKKDLSYIIGNPPFGGKKEQSASQKMDMELVFSKFKGTRILDYVSAWYIKAAQYIQKTPIKVAFVSTNSICQGEQVSILWGLMMNQYNMTIHFAHRTFKWSNEAKGNAAVHCVIIGFANFNVTQKSLFEYEDVQGEAHEKIVANINSYLIDATTNFIGKKSSPICKISQINYG
ncbi:MAG: N-6 DNA methylase, partial [Neisseriaceae bacterium]|nr:N-6 DNA methylase [Neisseriaceae bacterium]